MEFLVSYQSLGTKFHKKTRANKQREIKEKADSYEAGQKVSVLLLFLYHYPIHCSSLLDRLCLWNDKN